MGRKLYAKGEGFNPTTGIDDVEGLREALDALEGGGGSADVSHLEDRLTDVEGDISTLQTQQISQGVSIQSLQSTKLDASKVGAASGVASLDENGRVPSSQLPSYVDDVIEVANYESLPTSGESGKIYITQSDNKTYRWSGNGYAEVSASLALGETEQTAYSGAKGKKNATDIATLQSTKASKTEAQGYATTAMNEAIAAAAADAQEKANTAESNAKAYADNNKLGKTEQAADSAKLGGVGADGYTRVLKGNTTTGNNHLYIGTLPVSSSSTRDSISIRGTIGSYAGDRDFVDIAIGRRDGLWFKGLASFRYAGTSSYWDIAVNDAGEVYVMLYGRYCAYHIEVSSQQVTIEGVHGRTPTDTNWRYLSEELAPFDVIKSNTFIGALQGNADSATKLATPRTIWGQSFDGTQDITGNLNSDIWRITKDQTCNGTFLQSKNYAGTSDVGNIFMTAWGGNYLSSFNVWAHKSIFTGNVAIGDITNPTEKLEVAGNIKASGMLTTGSDAQVGGAIDVEEGITSRGDIDASGNNIFGNLNGTISVSTATSSTALHIVGVQQTTSGKSSPFITPITITDDDMAVGGNVVITGTMTATATYHSSDERLKTFEGDVEVDLEKLKALPKKYFKWKTDEDGRRQLGTSAQAVEKLFPELVSTDADDHKSVNYANLSIVALAAIDKLAEKNDKLVEQNTELSKKNAELERRLAKIEKLLNIE